MSRPAGKCRDCSSPVPGLAWYCNPCSEARRKSNRQASAERKRNGERYAKRFSPYSERFRSLAGRFVAVAIEAGALPVLDGSVPCVDCGSPADEYDHRDYAKPIEVDAVCRGCNVRRGVANKGGLFRLLDERQTAGLEHSKVALQKAIDLCGGFDAFMKRIGQKWTKPWIVRRWLAVGVSPWTVSTVERATKGAVTRHDLRPDIFGPSPAKPRKAVA